MILLSQSLEFIPHRTKIKNPKKIINLTFSTNLKSWLRIAVRIMLSYNPETMTYNPEYNTYFCLKN